MKLLTLLFLIAMTLVAVHGATVVRSPSEVKEFEEFLRASVDGEPTKSDPMRNPEETSGKFEGDIVLSERQIRELVDAYSRNAVIDPSWLWPDGIVFYEINMQNFTCKDVEAITKAIDYIMDLSCLTFKERTDEEAYIEITGDWSGCHGPVGYWGRRQTLNLTPYHCFNHGTIVHEFLHALGFWHMHSSCDRDKWVRIVEENIEHGREYNFDKQNTTNLGFRYDYGSVMHYGEYAFSKNGKKTIIPLKPYSGFIGQREGMSKLDIKRLNKLYKC